MKSINILLAIVGGAVAGAALGLLLAPEKGSDLRDKIKDYLADKGINLKKGQLDQLVDEIASEIEK